MPEITRFCSAASLAVILLAGCDGAPATAPGTDDAAARGSAGKKTLTLHVPEMSDRLKLM